MITRLHLPTGSVCLPSTPYALRLPRRFTHKAILWVGQRDNQMPDENAQRDYESENAQAILNRRLADEANFDEDRPDYNALEETVRQESIQSVRELLIKYTHVKVNYDGYSAWGLAQQIVDAVLSKVK